MSEEVKDTATADDESQMEALRLLVATADENSPLAKAVRKMVDQAKVVFVNGGVKTRENLLLGEFITSVVALLVGGGKTVSLAEMMAKELLETAGVAQTDRNVRLFMQTYAFVCMVTGAVSVNGEGKRKENAIPKEFIETHAWGNLTVLKQAVVRSGVKYTWADGWRDKAMELLSARVVGDALTAECKAHNAKLDELAESAKRRKMTPDQIADADRKAINAKREKLSKAVNATAEKLSDAAIAAGFDRQHLASRLVGLGIIDPPPAKPTLADLVKMIGPDNAAEFAGMLIRSCDDATITAIASILRGHLIAANRPAIVANYVEANVN